MIPDLYNRQLHEDANPHLDEKTLAKQLAEKSDGKYTQAQVEDQLRIMGVSVNGQHESGAPDTLIGQAPTDSGARWISGGTTADGKSILTQVTAQADPELQQFILANNHSASPNQVPSIYTYDRPLNNDWGFSVARPDGPFTQFNRNDVEFMRNTTADVAAMVSTNAGRVSAVAGAMSSVPNPSQPAVAVVGVTASSVGLVASAIEQILRPNLGAFTIGFATDMAAKPVMDRFPFYGPVINEGLVLWKNSAASNQLQDQLNRKNR